MNSTLVATQHMPRPSIDKPSDGAKLAEYENKRSIALAEYEGVKLRLAEWRWSHDAAWLRLVTRYVELRTELRKSNDLLVLGTRMNVSYVFSSLGFRVIRDWLCREL